VLDLISTAVLRSLWQLSRSTKFVDD